ncbi:hypothetical protein FPZ47_16010, partial [Mycobacterium helveticum]
MSGPNPPGWEPEEPDSVSKLSPEPHSDSGPGGDPEPGDQAGQAGELEPFDDAEIAAAERGGRTDAYSRAYSAPESEHFTGGPYMPADLRLYDYDDYDEASEPDDEHRAPRWPWVVGVAAIVAAIALVVSVSLLVARTDTSKLANPATTTPAIPSFNDLISTMK